LSVDGAAREALVFAPAKAANTNTSVVFVFHGHGGTAANVARSFAIQRHWPEAIVVYPQGLNTPGQLTDPDGNRPGWQKWPGDQQDRDLKFFDALLKHLKARYVIDEKRVYATGHSNGGGFSYLLWAARPDAVRAVAPSAAAPNSRYARDLKPKPVLHLAGKKDALVKFEWQERTWELVRKINGCTEAGRPWEKKGTLYESAGGTPLVTYVHDGGHQFPPDGPALIVKFFQEIAP
jgi:polyhydroxybutyrate depolymerase